MKRFVCFLMTILMACNLGSVSVKAMETNDGDANLDGIFDLADIVFFQKYLLALQTLTPQQVDHADYWEDGKLDCFDLVAMRQTLVHNTQEDSMMDIQLKIGDTTFSAKLYQNESARAFLESLPMTLEMQDLNSNEKFYYFDNDFPTDSEFVGNIHSGDIMLYGSNCLVLFYDSFSTPYRYTKLGYVEYPENLADVLGSGKVTITFEN